MVSHGRSVAVLKGDTTPAVSIHLEHDAAMQLSVGSEATLYAALIDKHFTGHVTAIEDHSALLYPCIGDCDASDSLVKITFNDPTIQLPKHACLRVWLQHVCN